jgi:hypothetical protein
MPREKKADQALVQSRVDEILRIRLDGASRTDILQYVAEKRWEISERQVDNYIQKTTEILRAQAKGARKGLLALHIGRREALYARAVNAGDYGRALAVLESLAKLQGLVTEKHQVKHSGSVSQVHVYLPQKEALENGEGQTEGPG